MFGIFSHFLCQEKTTTILALVQTQANWEKGHGKEFLDAEIRECDLE